MLKSVGLMLFLSALLASPVWAQEFDTQGHADMAQSYMQQGQYDYAGFEWRKILAVDPKNLQAHLGLAEALVKGGFIDDAIAQLETARRKNKDTDIILKLAELYEKKKDYLSAAQQYDGILLNNPFNAPAYRGLRRIVPKLPKEERNTYNKQLQTTANQAKIRAKKAIKLGNYAEAARFLEIVAFFNKNLSDVNDLGLALFLAGNRKEAGQQFNQLKQSGKVRCEIKANASMVLLGQGRAPDAAKLMEDTIGSCNDPKLKPALFNNLGYIYEMDKKWTKARFAYERAISLNPTFTKAQMNLGFIYQRQEELDKAVNLYQTLLQREPNNAEAWNQLGFTYELKDKPKDAISAYKRAIAANPGYKDAYYNLGMLYKKEDKMDEAADMFKKMSDLEFTAMENPGQQQGQKVSSGNRSELFHYVDLFFSDPML